MFTLHHSRTHSQPLTHCTHVIISEVDTKTWGHLSKDGSEVWDYNCEVKKNIGIKIKRKKCF